MAQPINATAYRGSSRQQIVEALSPSLFLKPDHAIEGIRLTKEEHLRFLCPVLIKTTTEDERNEQREIQHGDNEIHVQYK